MVRSNLVSKKSRPAPASSRTAIESIGSSAMEHPSGDPHGGTTDADEEYQRVPGRRTVRAVLVSFGEVGECFGPLCGHGDVRVVLR